MLDVTERKRADEALRESEERFRVLADSAPALIWVNGPEGCEYVNRSYLDFLGVEVADVRGYDWSRFIHPNDREDYVSAYLAAAERHALFEAEFRFWRCDGAWRWMRTNAHPRLGPGGEYLGYAGITLDETDRRAAEQALAESEARFREAADSAPAPMWMTNADGEIEFVNKRFQEFAGLSGDALKGDVWKSLVHPDDWPWVAEERAAAWKEGHKAYVFEAHFRHADGGWRWLEVNARPRLDLAGGFHGYVGLAIDRTESRAAEERLRESEERKSAMFEAALDSIISIDEHGRIVEFNAAAEATFGYSRDDVIGRELADLIIPPDYRDRHRLALARQRARGASVVLGKRLDLPAMRADGSQFPAELTINRTNTSHGPLYTAYLRDVSERKRAQSKLAESEARFRAMADNAAVMVWVTEPNASCTYLSKSWYEFTGQTEEEALGFGWLDATHPDDRPSAESQFRDANERQAPFRLEYRLRRRDGEYRWCIDTARPRFGGDGEFWGFIGSVLDIDERKKAEEHRKLLVDELNHRVKNTLAVVQGLAYQTFRAGEVEETARKAFEGRLAALAAAHNLLTQANWSYADLGAVVKGAVEGCASPDSFSLDGPRTLLTPKQAVTIAMTLHELCTNAMKYGALSTETGKVSIKWRLEAGFPTSLRIEWREEGGPPVAAPARRGFGLRMIEQALAFDIGGEARIDFRKKGLVCTIDCPAAGRE